MARESQQRQTSSIPRGSAPSEERATATKPSASATPPTPTAPLTDAGTPPSDGGTENVAAITGVDGWLGLYRGSDVTRYIMPGQGDRNFDDPNAKIRLEKRSPSRIGFVLIDSSNGQDLCELQGEVNGNDAKLTAGQRCFIDPDDEMRVSSRPGLAHLNGNKLTLNVVFDATLAIDGEAVDGRIEYEYEGRRQ